MTLTLREAAQAILQEWDHDNLEPRKMRVGTLFDALRAALADDAAVARAEPYAWFIQWNSGDRILCKDRSEAELGLSLYPGTGEVVDVYRAAPANAEELRRLRLVASDAKELLASIAHLDGGHAGSAAALAESLGAWERGENLDEDDLSK